MSVDIATKKRVRAKKPVVSGEGADVGLSAPTSSKTKGRQSVIQAAEAANESVAAKKAATKRPTTTKVEAVTSKKPSKISTSKLSAKNSNNEAPLPPSSSTISMTASKILTQADAFSQSAVDSTDIKAPSSTNRKVASATKTTSKVAQTRQYQPTQAPSTTPTQVTASEGTPSSQATQDGANLSAAPSRKASNFMTSFFNDPEPAPTGGIAIQDVPPAQPTTKPADGKKKQTVAGALAKHQTQQQKSTTPPTDPRYDTLPPMKPYTTSSFAALKAKPSIPTSFSSSATLTAPTAATSTSSAPSQLKGIRFAPVTTTPPSSPTPPSQTNPLPPPLPTHNIRLPTPPPRPTTLPLSELKLQPEFRRKSRQWTLLIVGLPILIGTSWELFQRDYAKRRGARYQFKGWMAAGGDLRGAAVGKGEMGSGRKFREIHGDGGEGAMRAGDGDVGGGVSGEDGEDGERGSGGGGSKRLLEEK